MLPSLFDRGAGLTEVLVEYVKRSNLLSFFRVFNKPLCSKCCVNV